MPRRIKLILEYDGTEFHGWQAQPRQAGAPPARTVQGELERALRELTGLAVPVAGASRTDAGVHALGQVASFDLADPVRVPTARLAEALNGRLPADVSILEAAEAPPDFHARFSARGKEYCYSILEKRTREPLWRRTHWQVRWPLDTRAMQQAAGALVGEHDFAAFAAELAAREGLRPEPAQRGSSTVRQVRRIEVAAAPPARLGRAEPAKDAREIRIHVEGSGFLYKMVRAIAGSLVEVGRGARPPEWLREVLASRDRRRAGPTAPPQGLCLVHVIY